jgi:hypothetical protein
MGVSVTTGGSIVLSRRPQLSVALLDDCCTLFSTQRGTFCITGPKKGNGRGLAGAGCTGTKLASPLSSARHPEVKDWVKKSHDRDQQCKRVTGMPPHSLDLLPNEMPLTAYGQYTEYSGVAVPTILAITDSAFRGCGITAQRLHDSPRVFAMMFPPKASAMMCFE